MVFRNNTMDLYELINSKAIADHCRRVAHRFTPLEAAYLVYANDSLNITQKHECFREIISAYQDVELKERDWTPHFDSLHEFLRCYMELQNKYLAVFYRDEPDCVYSYEVWYSSDDDYTEDGRLFSSFDNCYKAMKADVDDLVGFYENRGNPMSILDIRMKKQWINADGEEYPRQILVCIDYENQPTEIWESHSIVSKKDHEILNAFEGLWPEIPTPFQKGDILMLRSKPGAKNSPFVLDKIPYWIEADTDRKIVEYLRKNGDCSDLCTSIYGQDSDGTIWLDHGPSYLDMEYCNRELTGVEKFLIAVSNYLKGDLPLELLIRSYDILKCEHHATEERHYLSRFTDFCKQKAGLS